MHLTRPVTVTALVLTLGACASIEKARDRIVRPSSRCVDQTVQVYFEPASAEVTREGRAVITAAATEARGCKVTAVEVMGLSDASGAADANFELSKRRAQSVTAALASAGLPAAEFKVAAAGQAGAMTADGKAPLRRRVDVILHLTAEK